MHQAADLAAPETELPRTWPWRATWGGICRFDCQPYSGSPQAPCVSLPPYAAPSPRLRTHLLRNQDTATSRPASATRPAPYTSIRMVNPGSDEDLIFVCHPWFYWSYPEGVCVNVAQGKVASVAYYH